MFHAKSNNAVLIPSDQFPRHIPLQQIYHERVSFEGVEHIAVSDDYDTCKWIASFNYYLPGPIIHKYHWPTHFNAPFDHQVTTANFLSLHDRAFCFNDIGTGKTLSALWAADFLQLQGRVKKVLIISTLSTIESVWASDIFRHFPGKTFALLYGSKAKRIKELSRDVDFYIINHSGIRVILEELVVRSDIELLIVDEGSVYRNSSTDLYSALGPLAHISRKKKLWWLTGGPMPNAPSDVWAQARMVNPALVPKYFSRFRRQIEQKVTEYKWAPRPGWEQIVYASLRPVIRFQRDQCIDLPPLTEDTRICNMSPEQLVAYNELKEKYRYELGQGLITAVNEGVKLGKLLQIASGAVYDTERNVHFFPCAEKLALLDEVIFESGRKCIVATPYIHSIEMLEKHIARENTVRIVNGSVSPSKRHEIFQHFQEGDLQVLLVHPKVMAHGLNLTRSSTICWWGPFNSFDVYSQACLRITRPGQTKHQYVRQLICSDVERQVYRRLRERRSMQGLLLDLLSS